jgi:phosphoglycolate phosphatase
MSKTIKPDSIFFDMDGTLWDGVNTYAQGFNDFFEANNIKRRVSKDDLYRFMGMEEEQYLENTLPELSPTERKAAYQEIIALQYKRIDSEGGELYQGVKEGLTMLAEKYKLFIVSNCPEFTIQHFMNWAQINELITDSMSHGVNYKPKHENIRLLIEKHQLKSPIYIGDTDSDRKQCDLLRIPFGFVSYGFGASENYNFRFDSFEELTQYFYAL